MAIAAAAAASPATAGVAGWEHPGFDAEDSYYNPTESVIDESGVGRLERRWSVRLRDSGFSRPIVAGDRVIAIDGRGISAYSISDGSSLWHFDEDGVVPAMAVSGGLLIAASGDRLTALDLTSGKVRWQRALANPIRAVVVDRGVVVVSGWSPSDAEKVAAYRAADGEALWSKSGWGTTGVSLNGVIMMRKTDGYGLADGGTSAIDILDGSLRWSELANWTAEAAFDGLFYVSDARGDLLAVDGTDGAVLWTASLSSRARHTGGSVGPAHIADPAPIARPVRGANALIAVDGRRIYRAFSRSVEALDVRDGRRVWSTRLAREAGQPIRAGGLVHAGGAVLRAADGVLLKPSFPGRVIVSGGTVYGVSGSDLVAFR
ncbi:PQQ-binding-like beta-propeller repeat protein [Actinoplanes sp. NPDC023714]|uniref:outer membrane protein assembly factor BamB family protein n=1 Tax=Actinoplanes sp. NPDC023714 TaxID=3154322 RepID=UPI00340C00C1